ncbi:MAG: hypothetical protein RR933_07615, partial [Oscillospiraceae bacterium]
SSGKSRFAPVAVAVLFGLVGGFPVGAAMLVRLAENGFISKKRAALLLCGCVNAGPAFVISSVGIACFDNALVGALMLISLLFASVVCILFSLVFFRGGDTRTIALPNAAIRFSFNDAVCQAVRSTSTLCAYVVFFACVNAFLQQLLLLLNASDIVQWAICSFLEVTAGCVKASTIAGSAGALLACAGISLCSVSIIMQIKSICTGTGISLKYLILSRPAHCALSVIMLGLLLGRYERSMQVFAVIGSTAASLFCISPLFSLMLFFLCFTALVGERKNLGFTKG